MLPEQKPFCSLPLVLGFPPESKTLSPSFQPAPLPLSLPYLGSQPGPYSLLGDMSCFNTATGHCVESALSRASLSPGTGRPWRL